MRFWRAAYAAVLWFALPVVIVRLWWRGRREPRYHARVGERFGRYRSASPRQPVIWLHAVSVGETRTAQPLLASLAKRFPECSFVLTQMTAAGRETAEELFAGKAVLAWLPYDYRFAVRRFLAHFRPRLGILMETEVWFNLVRGCREAGVPLLLANARLSEKSARGYEAVAPLAREAFSALAVVAAQTPADAERIGHLGARNICVTGNLKFDVNPAAEHAALSREFRQAYGKRKVFLAASTREGEEELLLEALAAEPLSGVITVIVPRHPQRFREVEALLVRHGRSFARRSSGIEIPQTCEFVLGDSLGELAAYYAAADVAFVGGSLMAYGGQNLIEACAAGVPVLIGPYTYNFEQAADSAVAEGAALRLPDAGAIVRAARELLSDDAARGAMGQAGIAFCARHRGATERVAALAEQFLKA